MEALRTSYKCLVISLVLGLLVGFFTWAPTPVVNAGEEQTVIGGSDCWCSGTDHYSCPGCTEYSYTHCFSDPPDSSTCEKTGTDCTASHCDGTRESCECI